jgi:tetratricopeptide (TPR) repeat protein
MRRLQLVSAGSLKQMLQAANEAYKRRDLQQSIELFERASRLDPANWRLRLHLGHIHGCNFDYTAAERCFEQAVRIAPNKTEALATAGRSAIDFGGHQMAEDYLRRAVEQKSATLDTVALLAEVYERLHRTEDAAAMVERALQSDNACPLARLTQAKLHRQAGRLAEAEEALRPLLTAADRKMRVRGFYELGGIYDRQGRYDEAMTAFRNAKALLKPDAPPLLAEMQIYYEHVKQFQNEVSAEILQRWFDSAPALAPAHRLAFLGGHARSGTTLLEQVLDAHPDIVSTNEASIFNTMAYTPLRSSLPRGISMLAGLEAAQTETLLLARERYFRAVETHLGNPVGHRLLIDKNPGYQSFIPGYVRFFPEIKLIVALRDPRDVVLSNFMQAYPSLVMYTATFLNLGGTVKSYNLVMGMWKAIAPLIKNPCLEVRYEDMVDDLEPVARKTLDFLGVPWDARVLGFDEHARKKLVHSPTYADVTEKVYKRARGRWHNYRKYLEPHLAELEPLVKAFGYE